MAASGEVRSRDVKNAPIQPTGAAAHNWNASGGRTCARCHDADDNLEAAEAAMQ
ncbi:MAG: hypothetical protein M9896_14035 [Candidatus Promineofilum sp.]|uniref:hypothetical protein n=1 Tax=Promineifilum sp. TaxID=2664178 RepID=UPI002411E8CB|nr:hypothetical protein [Promineifilum sp.]